jgi:hypothetical protein
MSEQETPILNVMIEDYLAHAGSTDGEHAMALTSWLRLGAEYIAQTGGRQYALDAIDNLRRFVRDAQPARPWKS